MLAKMAAALEKHFCIHNIETLASELNLWISGSLALANTLACCTSCPVALGVSDL